MKWMNTKLLNPFQCERCSAASSVVTKAFIELPHVDLHSNDKLEVYNIVFTKRIAGNGRI